MIRIPGRRRSSALRSHRSRGARRAGVVLGLAAVAAVGLTACTSSATKTTTAPSSSAAKSASAAKASTSPSSAPSTSSAPKTVVDVTTFNNDGAQYGVGMPVIAYFSQQITDAKDWQDKTKVTVNGSPIVADWYFESSEAGHGPLEAHLRPQTYWPAHASIHVTFPPAGTSLGGNFVSDGALTSLSFTTGAANISTINDATHTMTVTSDGQLEGTYPVSLGAASTPTYSGIKVIMEKVPTVCMTDTTHTYNECGIKWDQRLTYSGEYLHAAPWNCTDRSQGCTGPGNNIGHADSSNGCTNLTPAVAQKLYNFFEVGDVFTYPNANGPAMTMGAGFGDWNVNWGQWQTGGAVPTTS